MRPHVTGLRLKSRKWRQKWYYLPDDERDQLRQRYHNDKDAYFAAFRLDAEDQEQMLELGMAAFVKMEARLLSNIQFDHYEQQAQKVCSQLMQNMVQGCSAPNLVFVAIDFEGDATRRGVTELGLARCDVQHLERGILGSNIATARRNRRDYLFGDYMKNDIAQLPATIVSHLSDEQIVLVGHNIQCELTTMEQLGVPIEDLPHVIGIVDTVRLGSAEIGHEGTLQSLMDALHISYEPKNFRCAGNDAYYTMQAFLALAVHREERTGRSIDGRVGDRLRELAWAKAPLKREIRQKMDECVAGQDSGEECTFGGLFDSISE